MRKILCRSTAVIISAAMLILSACTAVCAEDAVTWEYDETTKTVTITGSGALSDGTPIDDYVDVAENIVVSDGITSIGTMVFAYLTNTTSVTLPSTVKSIDEKAFYYSNSIEKINLPEGVETIGDGAFEGCSSLSEITIPASVSSIGDNAFGECYKLKEFKTEEGGSYSNIDGVLTNAACDTIVSYPTGNGGNSYTVPDGIKVIGKKAFSYSIGLESVDIGSSVETIEANAFYFCKDLKNINFASGLKSIGDGAFYNCAAEAVLLPLGLESIGKIAFKNSHNLKYIYIPKTVETIGEEAFYGADSTLEIGSYTGSAALEYAAETGISAKTVIGVSINGDEIEFDQPGILINSYTMVPMRKIFESLGAEVDWNDEDSTAIGVIGDTTVSIKIGDNVLYKNGSPVELDAPAALVHDRTLVHVRAVAEAFGADVEWDGENGHVNIAYDAA